MLNHCGFFCFCFGLKGNADGADETALCGSFEKECGNVRYPFLWKASASLLLIYCVTWISLLA